jgi:hypothetical protein
VRGLLSDVNFVGQLDRILDALRTPEWVEFWVETGLVVETFTGLGLDPQANDRVLWERCQDEGLLLVTGNRNDDGPNSLEAAIRDGSPDALPVLTVSDGRRVVRDGAYALAVAVALLEVVHDISRRPETILGSGRIYLPRRKRSRI